MPRHMIAMAESLHLSNLDKDLETEVGKGEPPLPSKLSKQFQKKTQNQRKLVEFSSIKFSIFCETCPNTSFRGASQHGKIEDVNVAVDAVGGEAGCLSFGTHRTTLHQNLKIMKLICHNMFNLRMMLDRQRIKTKNNIYIISSFIRTYPYICDDSGYQLTKIWPRYMEPGICFPKLWQSYRTQLRKGQEDSGASKGQHLEVGVKKQIVVL